jgi:ESCRT-II complex subunit VPS22
LRAKFRETGNEIAKVQLKQMEEQMELFKRNLEQFAQKYKREINKNPEFRKHFNEMCAKIGVDPLVCSYFRKERIPCFI